jgi:hypothetical protein
VYISLWLYDTIPLKLVAMSTLSRPSRRLRRLPEGGAFSGFRPFLSRPRAWTSRRCTPTIHGRECSSWPRYSGRPLKADRDGRPRNGAVGSLNYDFRCTRMDTYAVHGRALVPEFRSGLRRPMHRLQFGSDALSCATFTRIKGVANALPPRRTHSLRPRAPRYHMVTGHGDRGGAPDEGRPPGNDPTRPSGTV